MDLQNKIILGCGNFGGVGSLPELVGKGESREQALGLLGTARDLGITQFDTANSYGQGASESFLGEWLSSHPMSVRQKMKVATKVGNPYGARPGLAPLSAKEILYQAHASLQRLQVEQIDLYYLHEFPQIEWMDDTLAALEKLIDEGSIAAFGLSNVGLSEVQSFVRRAGPTLSTHFVSVQNEFHYLQMQDAEALIPFLNFHGIKYSAFSPLAGGLLTGKYNSTKFVPKGSRLDLRREPYDRYLSTKHLQKIEQFVFRAQKNHQSPAAAALQFVLNAPGVHSAVIGPRKREHFETLGLI